MTLGVTAPTEDLRQTLRAATSHAHDRLDSSMRQVGDWTTRCGYVRFLQLQHAARSSVEKWLSRHARVSDAPPPQTQLIERDLVAMGESAHQLAPDFTHDDTGADAVLGIAWSLAGSSLGNRAILKDVRRAGGDGATVPCAFLSDPAMQAFWARLRRRIERPASLHEAAAASRSARALFEHFTLAAGQSSPAALPQPTNLTAPAL